MFFDGPISYSVSNYDITTNLHYAIFSGFLISIGALVLFKSKGGLYKLGLSVILLVGSFSCNLVIEESFTSFRSIVGIEMIVVCLMFIALVSMTNFIKRHQKITFLSMALVLSSLSQYNIIRGFIIPQNGELHAITGELSAKIDREYNGKVMFDISDPAYNVFSNVQRSDEFGGISSAAPWVIKGMAEQIKKVKGYNFTIPDNYIVSENNHCDEDCIVIKPGDAMRKINIAY
ncbi:hypothetical protein ETA_11270 [Erwinia tasmaniensis Et1/99]|uniref:Uncharacterized protein n=1 Tax=Erwinia tasmaniensis (strain DSM 17950 / CFBP 7177 / CIP 109463 / NCPPB 4357 / Et1/99) TaxID=465817 RepID=B2VDX9_ERWT9|nr:hypothetical protein ETA_11270 [Erwinia tasmaniensis Et1/99]